MGKENKALSESFIVGVIALVFLIVGYQTALFIHNAAVVKIAANRDEPDTVYVFAENAAAAPSVEARSARIQRQNSSHSPVAESVRRNIPVKKVESFPFDPNTVSVEDLCRLGFSVKQAESIERYRIKGGRFRRKEDFRKSYVVSDSIYSRLQDFIEIPLVDLNLADSADFDNLPGIGGWYASKMVAHRKSLGGYSHIGQLMDIYRFDKEKYDGLSDLITVSPENLTPYPLWELPADSLRNHPYIADYETARAIVLFRESNPRDKWTVADLEGAGVIDKESARRLSLCVLR